MAMQQPESQLAKFMAEISCYDSSMLVWLDETGCDNHNALRKHAYHVRGMPLHDHQLLIRGVRYSAIPIMSLDGIHDVHILEVQLMVFCPRLFTPLFESIQWLKCIVCHGHGQYQYSQI